jgi:hypothetical protein
MTKRILMITVAVVVGLTPGLGHAQGNSQGRGQGNSRGNSGGNSGSTDAAAAATVVFHDADRATFRNYFTTHKITAQPLPPGIAKNVARGKPLPPGIAKKALPADLLVLAPKVGRDVSFAIVGDMVVAHRAGVVVDLLKDIFR